MFSERFKAILRSQWHILRVRESFNKTRTGSPCHNVLEHLETRCLLSISGAPISPEPPIPIVPPPVDTISASSLTVASDGSLWFTDQNSNAIGRQTPAGQLNEYNIPTDEAGPDQITVGPDGNLWFVEAYAQQIGRITPAGKITEFSLPFSDSEPTGLTAGPLSSLWFTDTGNNEIGRITTAGKVTEFSLDSTNLALNGGIVAGPDGNLWAAASDDSGNGALLRMTSAGKLSSFALPDYPNDLTVGPDGNFWVAADGDIDRVTPAGVVTQFSLPNGDGAFDITAGPDSALYFGSYGTDPMGRITTSGTVAEFNPPGATSDTFVNDLASSAGGKIWYASDFGAPASFDPHNALLAGGLDASATAGSAVTSTVASFIDLAPGSDPSFYSAKIDWGDGTTSAGAITANDHGGFDVSGTHTWPIGSSNITVTITDARPAASDSGGLSGRTATAYGTVTSPAPVPQGTAIAVNATAGQLFSGPVASYTNVLLNSLSSYSANIDWGDGHISAGTIAADGTGGVTISGSNRYAHSGTYTVTTTLWPWSYWPIVPIAAGAGAASGGAGAVPTGSASSGVSSTGIALPGNLAGVPIAPRAQPPIVALPPIRWPPIFGPNSVTSTAAVAPGVMDGSGYSLLASSKAPFSGVVASFTLADPNADLSHFHATVNWNDSATRDWFTLDTPPTTGATITPNGHGGFTVSATANFSQFGWFHYSVLISDDRLGTTDSAIVGAAYGQIIVDTPIRSIPLAGGGLAATANGVVSGSATPPTPNRALLEHPKAKPIKVHQAANRPFAGDVAILTGVSSNAPNLADLQGTIDWGDGSAPTAAQFVRDRKGAIHVQGSHTFASGGNKIVAVSLTQTLYEKSSPTTDPPIQLPAFQTLARIRGGGSHASKYIAQPTTITATAGAPFDGVIATITGPVPDQLSVLEATVAWGDGTHSSASVISDAPGHWNVIASHTYAKKGTRRVRGIVQLQQISIAIGKTIKPIVVARFHTLAPVTAPA